MTSPEKDRKQLNVEVSSALEARVAAFAAARDISKSAAVRVLLDKALTDAGYPGGRR